MIKFENTEVMNFEGAIRGMRNPLNSWDKSDSYYGCRLSKETDSVNWNNHKDGEITRCEGCSWCEPLCWDDELVGSRREYFLGENDLKLAQNLIKAGSDHRKFLRQIFVSVDITAPLYWWKEFDTYKVGTVANSCSTMHTIHTKELTLDDFSYEHLGRNGMRILRDTLIVLNEYRFWYEKTKNKSEWWNLIQLLPTSYNQKRTVTLNYEVLRNIRHSDRRNHKLDEWRIGFMEWIDSLPYAKELLTT